MWACVGLSSGENELLATAMQQVPLSDPRQHARGGFLDADGSRWGMREKRRRRGGIRILAMDGGGMRGMALVQMLRQVEAKTGRRIHELFDLIGGTSTGGMLAGGLAARHFSLDRCDGIYRNLGEFRFRIWGLGPPHTCVLHACSTRVQYAVLHTPQSLHACAHTAHMYSTQCYTPPGEYMCLCVQYTRAVCSGPHSSGGPLSLFSLVGCGAGKLVFSNADETESYMSKFYKSSSQNYRVMTQGSKVGLRIMSTVSWFEESREAAQFLYCDRARARRRTTGS